LINLVDSQKTTFTLRERQRNLSENFPTTI